MGVSTPLSKVKGIDRSNRQSLTVSTNGSQQALIVSHNEDRLRNFADFGLSQNFPNSTPASTGTTHQRLLHLSHLDLSHDQSRPLVSPMKRKPNHPAYEPDPEFLSRRISQTILPHCPRL
ncbi:predicted protein [Plenodomus lingam JN3]|uniref:Predicted protein n=1 Tax=Leptosphaeria maculans (strain JN3 / isolate v23.1.3 / race Av1-4-5-6-7-8) TaxID=985895 RepID=E5A8K2_LEPMJ|nr:predicted protein [Plenodomus lingam JN3]CBX99947.1 predicted protein [Plenodomus lingam JN3]